MPRTALISGITGQDGAFLARLLLERGYTVWGGMRKSATSTTWRLAALCACAFLGYWSLNGVGFLVVLFATAAFGSRLGVIAFQTYCRIFPLCFCRQAVSRF